jgi:2-methylcitrate dehydratase PrpD
MEKLAQFCASLHYRDLSEGCRERAKMLIADSVTNIVSGMALPIAPLLRSYIFELGGNAESTFVGGKKTSSTLAVFAHSAIASATQWDDTHNRSSTHIGSAVVPAALALCEREGLGGKTVIESVVVGSEVMARVGMTLDPRGLYRKGVHPSSLCGPFGTAAASGKSLGFTKDQFLDAFGLAAVQASGLLCGSEKGPMSWYIQYGRAAENGVIACRLVRLGANAPENVFKDSRGFLNLFSDHPRLLFLRKDLGKTYVIEKISQKRYPCFQFGQSGLEAFFHISENHSLNPDEIKRIIVYIPSSAFKEIFVGSKFDFPPKTLLSAQTNLRFLIGLAVTAGKVSLDQLIRERRNPSVKKMGERVFIEADEELNKIFPDTWPARVEVYMKGGSKLSHSVLYPKGDWRNPMTWKELHEKFIQLVQGRIGPKASKEIWNQLTHLEELKNVKNLLPRRLHA